MAKDNTCEPWHTERSLRMILDAMPVGVSWATLSDRKIVYMNRRFTEIFGYVAGDVPSIPDWLEKIPVAAERLAASQAWGQCLEAQNSVDLPTEPIEVSIVCKDGAIKTVLHHGTVLPETDLALATFIDVSDRKRDDQRLLDAENRAGENGVIARTLLEQSREMIVISHFDRSQRYVSPAVYQITGLTAEQYLATPLKELIFSEDLEPMREAIESIANGTPSSVHRGRVKHKDGGYRWVEIRLRACVDLERKQAIGYVAIIRDIGEQKKQEELLAAENRRLTKDASQDELTGIPNRRLFNRRITSEVRRRSRNLDSMALLMVDVDKFKEYNDQYGHLAGDQRLKEVACVLMQTLRRDSDLVARFGGDEFVILLPTTDDEGAQQIARAIMEAIRVLAAPHSKSSKGVMTVSIGIACWPPGIPIDPKRLLHEADTALYQAKTAGRDTFKAILCQEVPVA